MLPLFVAASAPLPPLAASPMGLTGFLVFGALAIWLLRRTRWTPPRPSSRTGGLRGERGAGAGARW